MLIVGIDVGSRFHVAAFMKDSDSPADWRKYQTQRVELSHTSFGELRHAVEQRTPGGSPVKVAMEPTGRFYAETIAGFCNDSGWDVHWVENKTLHDYRTMMKAPSKSDDIDARLLAHYLYHNHTTLLQLGTTSTHLRYLCQELNYLNKQRTQYKNRLHQVMKAVFPELPLGTSKKLLSFLQQAPSANLVKNYTDRDLELLLGKRGAVIKQQAMVSIGITETLYEHRAQYFATVIQQLDDRIDLIMSDLTQLVTGHPDAEILLSFPGINIKTAAVLIGIYGDISHYPNRQTFTRRLGVAPNITESGVSVYSTTINRRSSRYARTALHFVAVANLSPSIRDTYFKQYFEARRNDKARGHNRKVFGRLKGKIAEVLYYLLRNRQTYDRERHTWRGAVAAEEARTV